MDDDDDEADVVLELAAKPVRESDGRRQFAALGGSLSQIGKPIGASKQSVDQWRKGAAVPDDGNRRAIAAHYGIPFASWGIAEPVLDLDADTADDDEAQVDALEDYRRLLRLLRGQLKRGALSARERAQLTDAFSRTLAQKARLERDRETLEDRTIRDHPKWQRLKGEIIAALLPHPAAARAVEAVITRILSDDDDTDGDT